MKGRRCFVCMDHIDGSLKIQFKKKFYIGPEDRSRRIVAPVCDLHFSYYAGRGWPVQSKPIQLQLF